MFNIHICINAFLTEGRSTKTVLGFWNKKDLIFFFFLYTFTTLKMNGGI